MLEQSEFHLHICTCIDRRAPEPAQQVDAVYQRLVLAQTKGHIGNEMVVGLTSILIERVTILQLEIQVWVVFSQEEVCLIGQIAVAKGHGEVVCRLLRLTLRAAIYLPCLAGDETVQGLHRIHHSSSKLTHKTWESLRPIIQYHITHSVCNFSYSYSSYSGGYQVIDCRRFYLPSHLPHQATTQRIGCRGKE